MAKSNKTTDTAGESPVFVERPTLRINGDELPQIEDWKVDDEYTLTVKVKLRSLSKSEYEKNPKLWGTFVVQSVKSDDGNAFTKGMDSAPKPPRTKGQ